MSAARLSRASCSTLLFIALTGSQVSAEECASDLHEKTSVREIISCMVKMEKEIKSLKEVSKPAEDFVPAVAQEIVANHRSKLPSGQDGADGKDATAPNGIVAASTRRCRDLGSDWQDYEAAAGRVIVGTGRHRTLEHGDEIAPYKINDDGGERTVRLFARHLAKHDHEVFRHSGYLDNYNGSQQAIGGPPIPSQMVHDRRTGQAGDNQPHNNMPPFVALYFCQYTGSNDHASH